MNVSEESSQTDWGKWSFEIHDTVSATTSEVESNLLSSVLTTDEENVETIVKGLVGHQTESFTDKRGFYTISRTLNLSQDAFVTSELSFELMYGQDKMTAAIT